MSNIKKVEKFLKDALLQVKAEDGIFDAALLDNLSDEEYDCVEFEETLMEIELSLMDMYPETPYFVYLMALVNKIKEVYGLDEENIYGDYLIPDEDFVLDFPDEEFTDEDMVFEQEDDNCLEYLFE